MRALDKAFYQLLSDLQ